MKQTLGEQEARFFAYVQLRNLRVVRTGDLREPLGLSALQERELFRRLARGKLIARVRPGLYLVPDRLPMGGAWTPGEILALNTLMDDRNGRYQICGPNAFNRYGYDEQLPARVYAYNNRISGKRTVGAVNFSLIKVTDERLGSTEEVTTREGDIAVYSSRPRTLLDAVYDWSRFDTLPRGFMWIRRDLEERRVSAAELIDVTLKYGSISSIRRIGALLEQLKIPASQQRKLEDALPSTTAEIPWIPTLPKRGRVSGRWGVVMNGEI